MTIITKQRQRNIEELYNINEQEIKKLLEKNKDSIEEIIKEEALLFFKDTENYIYDIEQKNGNFYKFKENVKKRLSRINREENLEIFLILLYAYKHNYNNEFNLLNEEELSKKRLINSNIHSIIDREIDGKKISERQARNYLLNIEQMFEKIEEELLNFNTPSEAITSAINEYQKRKEYKYDQLIMTETANVINESNIDANEDYIEKLEENDIIIDDEKEYLNNIKEVKEEIKRRKKEGLTIVAILSLLRKDFNYDNLVFKQEEEGIRVIKETIIPKNVYVYNATLDSKTCGDCESNHKLRSYNMYDLPEVPQHPNCRCYIDIEIEYEVKEEEHEYIQII